MKPKHIIEKVGRYFKSPREQFKQLSFAIIVFYPTGPVGRGMDRVARDAITPETFEVASRISRAKECQNRGIILVDIAKKHYGPQSGGARSLSKYYYSSVSKISGRLLISGEEIDGAVFFHSNRCNA